MVIASLCVGLTLPGMIELPGSFSGIVISPMPQRGPEASQRTSLAIFISDAASVFSAPWANTSASCAASASNLLGAVTNGWPVSSASFAATRSANSGWALRPVPTAVPPRASSHRCGSAASTWRPVRPAARRSRRTPGPAVSGVASCRWVRPIFTMSLEGVRLGASASRRAAGRQDLRRAAPPPPPRAWRWGRRRSTTGPC